MVLELNVDASDLFQEDGCMLWLDRQACAAYLSAGCNCDVEYSNAGAFRGSLFAVPVVYELYALWVWLLCLRVKPCDAF